MSSRLARAGSHMGRGHKRGVTSAGSGLSITYHCLTDKIIGTDGATFKCKITVTLTSFIHSLIRFINHHNNVII